MSQTSYSVDPVRAMPGMFASGVPNRVETRVAYEDLAYGRFVRVRSDGKVEYATNDSGVMAGVTCYQDMTESSYPQGSATIKAGSTVAICYSGDIWVDSSGTQPATEHGTVKVVNATGKGTDDAASAGTIRDMSSRAIFIDKDKNPTGLAKVRLNLP